MSATSNKSVIYLDQVLFNKYLNHNNLDTVRFYNFCGLNKLA